MPVFHFTARGVASVKPSAKRVDYFDEALPGLCLRVQPSGKKSYAVLYRSAGSKRLRRYTLGSVPPLDLAKARKRANEILVDARNGKDPQGEKVAARDGDTFGELAAVYLAKHAPLKRSGAEDRRQLELDVLPAWKHRKAREITRRDIVALIERKAEVAPIGATRLLAVVRKVFNWSVETGRLDASPCISIKRPREQARSRVLTADEIREVWALDSAPLRLLLLLGQRASEVCGMQWSEVEGDWWTLPGERTKNGRVHRVPLVKLAREIIAGCERRGRFVFPAERKPHQPVGRAVLAALLRKHRVADDPYTLHDLRRTCSSSMARLGVEIESRAAVLNHTLGDTTSRHYTVHDYDAEKRAALETWETELRKIIQ